MEKVYPSWRYHKSNEALIVNGEAEDKELGKGWTDSPVAQDEAEETLEVILKDETKPKRQAKDKQ